MKKNKINKYLVLSLIGIVLVVAILISILNLTKDTSSLSFSEKQWINNNTNDIINVSVFNDVPIYGYSGQGIAFDMLDGFTNAYDINFNKVSYTLNNDSNLEDIAFKAYSNGQKIKGNDILLYTDNYVLVSNNNKTFTSLEDIHDIEVGVLSEDISSISEYLPKDVNISYTPYTNLDTMIASLTSDKNYYFAIPLNTYLDKILENNLNIVYHISEVNKKYVLEINNNKQLLSIMKKYYKDFMDNDYKDSYKANFLSVFFDSSKISEEEQAQYNSTSYNYGYVVNMPYENEVSGEFVGTFANILKDFTNLTDIDINYTKYKSVSKLKSALKKGDIDVAFNYYDINSVKKELNQTTSIFDEKYVILSKDYFSVNSLKSLKNKQVLVVKDTTLYDQLKKNDVKVKKYNNTDDLLRNVESNSIIAINYDTYEYYKSKKFANYNIVYQNNLPIDYNFIVRKIDKNETVFTLLNYYLSTIDYNQYKFDYNEDYYVANTNFWKSTIKYTIFALTLALVGIIIAIILLRKKQKKLSKEDKFKFIDIMTSLKNRNYLNYNISKWEENNIYPQAIMVIDVSNIKYINDNYGHEEGDNVIVKTANVLVSNQLENTDIIRTDGTEFLIYLVGYNESNVNSYVKKLSKELKDLPYNFGAIIGYSMITDEAKTIDDAINEATLSMREQKEKN